MNGGYKMVQEYVPDRNHIIWLDFDPQKGKEIGKYRPAFVLSSKSYNTKTGLVICCPISTSIRGGLTEVPLDMLDAPSVIASSIIQTLSWKERKIKFITKTNQNLINDVLDRLLPLIGA
jgi:mRNA interferase MazF